MTTKEKANKATSIALIVVTLLSLAGLVTSLHLADMHYKHPGRAEKLFKNAPILKPLKSLVPQKYLMPEPVTIIDKPVDVKKEVNETFDPYSQYKSDSSGEVKLKEQPKKEKESCDINETFTCGKVDQSKYSELPINSGFGVSLYGVLGYLMLVFLGTAASIMRPARPCPGIIIIYLSSIIGFGFSIYLTYLEAYKIKAYCPYCLCSAGFMTAIFLIMTIGFSKGIFKRLTGRGK